MEKMLTIEEQIVELLSIYKKLKYKKIQQDYYKIYGELEFKTAAPEIIRGKYQIEILVTKKFPNILPIVKETAGDVPKFFHKNTEEILCLGVETEQKIFLQKTPNLLKFVNAFVIPYFYSFKIWQKTGEIPFGERSHEIKGILEFYREYLCIDNIQNIMDVLLYAHRNKRIELHKHCPCGSGKNINECYHYYQLKELSKIDIKEDCVSLYCLLENKVGIKNNVIYPLTDTEFKRIYSIKNSSK